MTHDVNIKSFNAWLKFLGKKRPICIAGPCSAETEVQVMKTAKQLKETAGLTIYRSGIWKPRTRPNTFEGVGEKGLPWLKRVKDELNMFVTTEVANGYHVEKALKYDIDILWIGARSTANPFVVQEIANALKGVNIPVMIKNPINPDIALWLGAVERVHSVGIDRISAIHRGFSSFGAKKYRNLPQWQIPIEFRNYIPNIPMICDPSHIAGNKERIEEISQRAMDLNFDGLIIESHFNPEAALSDAQQQLTPKKLKKLLDKIQIRKLVGKNEKLSNTLTAMRSLIDDLDASLLDTMEKRMKIVETIGMFKKQNNLIVLQQKRWDELMRKNLNIAKKKGLSKTFVNNFFKFIHQESINKQSKIIND